MKKVLVITYYWPPSGGAGVQRWLKFVKYLREFGWEPVVYTPENPESPDNDNSLFKDIPDGITILKTPIREPYSAYKRFTGQKKQDRIQAGFLSEKKKNPLLENISIWIRGNFFIPDARVWWVKPSVKFLKKYLAENPVDAVVSTGPPHSLHLIAMKLKKDLNLPWLADFRDPWTNIDFYDKLKLTPCADRRHKSLEKRVLSAADRVTAVSWHMAMDFEKIRSGEYDVITNGFDPDDFPVQNGNNSFTSFDLTHIGSINSARNPEFLWQTIDELCGEDPQFSRDLKMKFIGKNDLSLRISLERHQLLQKTEMINYLPHDEALKISSLSGVLLLLLNNSPNVKGILTGKLFEYLAARRPILCIGPTDGDCARVIAETGAGYTCDFGDISGVKTAIRELYQKFCNGNIINTSGDIENYSRKNLTSGIAAILDEMTGK